MCRRRGRGGIDRNGDGDATDTILEAIELSTGRLLSSGRATGASFVASGDLVVQPVPELFEGRDLNDDGDQSDVVLHVTRTSTGVTWNLRRALSTRTPQLQGRRLLYCVSETAQREDLDGDGDTLDTVWEIVDLGTGRIRNTGLASSEAFLGEDVLGILVDEAASAATDLNGDGDAFDFVMHAGGADGAGLVNLGLAARDAQVRGGSLAWIVDERRHQQDVNGDGDLFDFVPHYWRAGVAMSLGYAGNNYTLGENHLAMLMREADSGSIDLDGNGRTTDDLVVLRHLATGRQDVLGGGAFQLAFQGDTLFFALVEDREALDLNLDGDLADVVLQAWDLRMGTARNLGLAGSLGGGTWSLAAHAPLLLRVPEVSQGVDLNGDGILSGDVLHAAHEFTSR